MKISKLTKIAIATILLSPLFYQNASAPNKKTEYRDPRKTIVIDPGHGHHDLGYNNKNVVEKDINIKIANYLIPLLEKQGYKVYTTRTEDTYLNYPGMDLNNDNKIDTKDELIARRNFSKNLNADYFLSLHNNADLKTKWTNGLELWIYGYRYKKELTNNKTDHHTPKRAKYKNEEAYEFAKKMEETFSKAGFKTQIGCGDFTVLENHPVPKSLIIEYGYLTNPDDLRRMQSDDFQKYCAEMTAKYFKKNETPWKN